MKLVPKTEMFSQIADESTFVDSKRLANQNHVSKGKTHEVVPKLPIGKLKK
jgi:hypothetical protein